MVKQMGAVLGSYEQRCRSLVAGTLVAGGLLQVIVTLCVAPHTKSVNTMLPFIAMGTVFLGMNLWLQLRLHVLTSRRFTWPRYIGPQLLVFSTFAMVLAVGWPVAITLLHGGGGIGLTALVLAIFAVIGWCIVMPSLPLILAAVAGYFWLCFGSIPSQTTLDLDRNLAAGVTVLLGSVAFIMLAVFRLTRIDEENVRYNKTLSFQSPDLLPKMTGQQAAPRRRISRFRPVFFSPSINNFLPRPGNRRANTRRWRYFNRAALWFPLFMSVGVLVPQLFFANRSAASLPTTVEYPSPVLLLWLFISGGFVVNIWLQSWRYLEMEFVRPVARRALLRDFALTMTVQTFQGWLIMTMTVLGVWIWKTRFHQEMGVVTEVIGVSVASQVVGLVVGFLVMTFRSPGGVGLAYLGVAAVGGGVVGAGFIFPRAAPWIAATVSIALLLGAAALLPVAIRRWNVTDLG